jgi:stearoyl-CoA desaturase (delta-9 desaturase)
VAVHRRHHAFTDVPGDPHSPLLEGFATVQIANVVLYRRVARDRLTVDKYAKDLTPDRWDKILFDHGYVGLGVGIGILLLVFWGNWELTAIAAGTHVIAYLGLNSAVNAVGHRFGRRPFAGLASNTQWLAWLTAGEGLHSNHHAAPTSARLSFQRGQIDPGWWPIACARRLGWLKVRHNDPRLLARADRTPQPV